MRGVAEVILIDMDTYERSNLPGQLISEGEIGKPKVLVQAERLQAAQSYAESLAHSRPRGKCADGGAARTGLGLPGFAARAAVPRSDVLAHECDVD